MSENALFLCEMEGCKHQFPARNGFYLRHPDDWRHQLTIQRFCSLSCLRAWVTEYFKKLEATAR